MEHVYRRGSGPGRPWRNVVAALAFGMVEVLALTLGIELGDGRPGADVEALQRFVLSAVHVKIHTGTPRARRP